MSKYFKGVEFKRCSPSCSIDDMDAEFLALLDKVREDAGIPLVLTCAFRSSAYDKAKGRTGNSAHCKGKGVDIKALSSQTRMKIVQSALKNGITRIGIGKTFVHIDNDKSLPQGCMWDYYE